MLIFLLFYIFLCHFCQNLSFLPFPKKSVISSIFSNKFEIFHKFFILGFEKMLEFLTFALFLERGEGLFFGLEKAGLPEVEILEPSKLPVKKRGQKSPKLLESERAAIFALDLGSGKVLLEKNADRAQPIASLTKIMTALVILDAHDLEAIVSVPLEATQVAGAKVDLFAYEKLRVKTLLEAILDPFCK